MDKYQLVKVGENETTFVAKLYKDLSSYEFSEIRCFYSGSIIKLIMEDIKSSDEAWKVITDTGEPLAVFGRKTTESGQLIWCLCTKKMQDYTIPFVKVSKKILLSWVEKYGLLYNCVAEFNHPSIKWLKALGAEFRGSTVAENGIKFLGFTLRREDMKCVR